MIARKTIACFILGVLTASSAAACTIFVFTHDGKTYFCNNEDWRDPITEIRFYPATEDEYAWVYLGFSNNWSQGGVNEHGLCYDWFAGGGPFGWEADPDKKNIAGNLSEELLRKCKNVDEAIEFYKKYNERSLDYAVSLIGDRDGNSVLVHWKDGELHLEKNVDSLHSCGVGKAAVDGILESMDGDFNVALLAEALEAGKSIGETATKYSNIISVSDGKMFLFQNRNYAEYLEIDYLARLKEPASTHRIADLFSKGDTVTGIQVIKGKPGAGKKNFDLQHDDEQQDSLSSQIDTYLKSQIELHQIPGLALGVIRDGEVVYESYFGSGDLKDEDRAINEQSVFPLYSATKLISTSAIFRLVDQGKVSIEDDLARYIEGLPESWHSVTIANLLTHSSGLPDFIRAEASLSDDEMLATLFKMDPHFESGAKFEYNQTNYWLLAKVVESVTGQPFDEHVFETQFPNSDGKVIFSFDSNATFPGRVKRYDYDDETNQFLNPTRVVSGTRGYAAGGLNVTLHSMIEWNKRIDGVELMSGAAKQTMWQPFDYTNKNDEFLHGWGIYRVNNKDSYGFTGGGQTGFRKFIDQDLSIIFLSNGYRYFPVHNRIINHVAGLVEAELQDTQHMANDRLADAFLGNDIEKAISEYSAIKVSDPDLNFEGALNSVGYMLLSSGRIKDAINVFTINTKEHPESANTYDSLGEAYAAAGETRLAITNYEKSIQLDSGNTAGAAILEELRTQETANQASDDVSVDESAIREQSRRFSDSYVKGDIDAQMAIYHRDAVIAPPGQSFIVGEESIRRYWIPGEGRKILTHKATPDEIVVDGNLAYDRGVYEGSSQSAGTTNQFRGKYLIVWRKSEGVWLMVQDMWNPLPVQ